MILLGLAITAPPAHPAHLKDPPDCTRGAFHAQAKATYQTASRVTSGERREVRRLVHCQRTARSRRLVRWHLARYKVHHAVRRLWAFYRAHPMPYCTWGPESGGNYRARNSSSTAGGKFQVIDRTWYANGGSRNGDSHPAAAASPLEQERVARRVLASQGLGAWVNC